MPTIAEIAAADPRFEILADVLTALDTDLDTGFLDLLDDRDPDSGDPLDSDFTVFAPTDAGFGRLAVDLGFAGNTADETEVLDFLSAELAPPAVADLILYHVAEGALTADDIAALDEVETLLQEDGAPAVILPDLPALGDGAPAIPDPMVDQADIPADNGVLHAIDRVLLPAPLDDGADPLPTLAELVGTAPTLDVLEAALAAAGLDEALQDPEAELTAFVPTDAAFAALAAALGAPDSLTEADTPAYLLRALTLLSAGEDPTPLLANVLSYHVAPGRLDSAAVLASDEVETLLGVPVGVSADGLVDADPDLPDAALVETNLAASNGIAHAIDGVLLPVDLLPSDGADDVDFFILGGRDDLARLREDDDYADGGGGDDTLRAGDGEDVLLGGEDDDILRGARGADTLRGGDGDDRIVGGKEADSLFGDADDDTIQGNLGADTVDGGTGDDTLIGGAEADDLAAGDDDDLVRGNAGADSITGGEGEDTLRGGREDDTISGGEDDDRIVGNLGVDDLSGDDGDDRIFAGAGGDMISGGAGDDTARGFADDDSAAGGDGDDRLGGNAGDDTLSGDDGQDTLIGGRDDDDLAGGAGDDRLFGNLGDDTLSGGDGEDTIVGGPGDDSQEGGADADVFVLAPGAGSDVIADFAAGEDALDLTAFGFADAEAVRDLLVSGTADATLAFDADSQVVLSGVAAGDLTDDAFLL